MRVTRKLMLAITAVLVILVGATGALWIHREASYVRSDAREDLSIMGRSLRPAFVRVWTREGRERALALLDYADRRIRQVDVRWVHLGVAREDPLAPLVDPSRLAGLTRREEVAVETNAGGGQLHLYVPVQAEGLPPGALELTQSLRKDRRFLAASARQAVLVTITVAVASVMLAVLVGAWLVGRPLKRLATHARRLAGGDLTPRLPVNTRDEIGEVAREMNEMCDSLLESRRRLECETSARIAALEQLRRSDRLATVGKLSAGIAHELGTPLNVVAGRAKMIAEGDVAGAEALASARIVADQAQRMAVILRHLLDFARRRPAAKAPVDLAALTRQTAALLEPFARKRGVPVSVETPAELVVDADGAQIQQVLANIILNGLQATPAGEPLVVTVEQARARSPHAGEGDWAALVVTDHGEGIAPDDLPHVFEPFFTTKRVGEGTGLGLSVAWGIVQEHGGWIDVDSRAGEGSRFAVYLPATPRETHRESGAGKGEHHAGSHA